MQIPTKKKKKNSLSLTSTRESDNKIEESVHAPIISLPKDLDDLFFSCNLDCSCGIRFSILNRSIRSSVLSYFP